MRPVLTKEEVRSAIRFKDTKHIPLWYTDFASQTKKKLGSRLKTILKNYPPDFICKVTVLMLSKDVDEWGVKQSVPKDSVGAYPIDTAIKDWSELDDYLSTLISGNKPRRFTEIEKLRMIHPDKYILGDIGIGFSERMQGIVGIEKFYMSLVSDLDCIKKLGDKLFEMAMEIVENLGWLGVDGVLFNDDYGYQQGLLMSPKIWRAVFKLWYKRLFEKVHSFDMDVIFHSCGKIEEIMDDLIEIGVNVLHPIQPGCMNANNVTKKYRGKICFFTGVDVQSILITASPDEVRKEVNKIKKLFTLDNGSGLIFGPTNAVMPETPIENIYAFFDEAKADFDSE